MLLSLGSAQWAFLALEAVGTATGYVVPRSSKPCLHFLTGFDQYKALPWMPSFVDPGVSGSDCLVRLTRSGPEASLLRSLCSGPIRNVNNDQLKDIIKDLDSDARSLSSATKAQLVSILAQLVAVREGDAVDVAAEFASAASTACCDEDEDLFDHTCEAVLEHFSKDETSGEWKDVKQSVDSKIRRKRFLAARVTRFPRSRKGKGKGKGKGKHKGTSIPTDRPASGSIDPVPSEVPPEPIVHEPVGDDPEGHVHEGVRWHTHFRILPESNGCRATCFLHNREASRSNTYSLFCNRTFISGVGMASHLDAEECVRYAKMWCLSAPPRHKPRKEHMLLMRNKLRSSDLFSEAELERRAAALSL